MKRTLFMAIITVFMIHALPAQTGQLKVESPDLVAYYQSSDLFDAQARPLTEVEKFIKKYEDKGNYAEMSQSYLEDITKRRKESMRYATRDPYSLPPTSGTLLSLKSLTVPTQYWDELQKAIERDNFERQSYTRKGESISGQYTKHHGINQIDCILIKKTLSDVTVIFMIGKDIQNLSDFEKYIQLIGGF